MASPFQRMSSFAPQQEIEGKPASEMPPESGIPVVSNSPGPDRSQLERWYQTLLDVLDRESDGDVDHTTELTDLRDEIYAHLY